MNAVMKVENAYEGRQLTAETVREHVNLIQKVIKSVMKEGVHYGIIPGCKLPSLYKAGSEVLLSTFRIAVSLVVEDLSTPDCIRYRVHTIGTHQTTGIVVGEGIGECSSDEAKYRWRRCYIKQEYEATTESRRRIKFSEWKGKLQEQMEVRTEPADLANTVLKMAKKRAQIDLTLTGLAASDCFTQDIEDMPAEVIRDHVERAHEAEMRRPENRGTPTAGAWEAIPQEKQAEMLKAAAMIADLIDAAEDVAGAVDYYGTLGYSNEEKIAFWTRLDSRHRTALNKEHTRRARNGEIK